MYLGIYNSLDRTQYHYHTGIKYEIHHQYPFAKKIFFCSFLDDLQSPYIVFQGSTFEFDALNFDIQTDYLEIILANKFLIQIVFLYRKMPPPHDDFSMSENQL